MEEAEISLRVPPRFLGAVQCWGKVCDPMENLLLEVDGMSPSCL